MNSILEKRIYSLRKLECVKLDYEISLALESEPPVGPNEPGYIRSSGSEYFNENPFTANFG